MLHGLICLMKYRAPSALEWAMTSKSPKCGHANKMVGVRSASAPKGPDASLLVLAIVKGHRGVPWAISLLNFC